MFEELIGWFEWYLNHCIEMVSFVIGWAHNELILIRSD